jgi:hypothetical protein
MESTNLVRRSPVQFSLIDPEAVRLLGEYIYKQIKNIPHPMRFNIINKQNNNNAQCFLNLYHQNFLDRYERRVSKNIFEYEKLSNLYVTVLLIINGIEGNSISKVDFNIRCGLLGELVPMAITDFQKYLDEATFNFHLFRCIHELIFNNLELSEHKREILNHRFCYSNKIEMLTAKEMARKLDITPESVYAAENTLERKIGDIIKKFKVLAPYYSYKSKYLSNAEIITITPDVFECIRRDEKADDMTACFIAKVLSVLYNYNSEDISAEGTEKYLLVQRGTDEMNKIIRFGDPYLERN